MEIEIQEYIAPLRKWWWLIVLASLVAAVSSYLATRQQIDVYRSTTTLMIGNAGEQANPSSQDFYTSQRLASFYVDLANRPSVRNAAKEALESRCDCQIRMPEIFIRQLNETNIVDIIVNDTSPARAQAIAAELANQLILRTPTAQDADSERQAFVNKQLDDYEMAITEIQAQIVAKQEELAELISARQIASVQSEIVILESNLRAFQSNYATLLQSTQKGATNTITVIEPASFPGRPVEQNNVATVITASGIGFVLAASAAYVLEYLDDTVKTTNNISKLTGLSTLAGIAEIKSSGSNLVTITEPRSPISEAFRVLRTAVQFSAINDPNLVLLITSAVPGDGKSIISSNLAVVMAQAGHNVLLVDTDLRRPSQHHTFNLPNKLGLTSLLLESHRAVRGEKIQDLVSEMAQATQVEGLQVLTCGPLPPNPSELLGSTKMKMLLDELATQFDFVILDSPPALPVTDAAVLSMQADRTLLVVRADKSRKEHVKQATERLREVNANLIGCVLNSLSPSDVGGRSSYYYDSNSYITDGGEDDVEMEDSGGKLRKRFLRKQTV